MDSSISFNTSIDHPMKQRIMDSSEYTNETTAYDYDDNHDDNNVQALNASLRLDSQQTVSPFKLSLDITPPVFSLTASSIPTGSKEEIKSYLCENLKHFIEQLFKDNNPENVYSHVLEWSIDEDPTLEYHMTISIRQPTIVTSI